MRLFDGFKLGEEVWLKEEVSIAFPSRVMKKKGKIFSIMLNSSPPDTTDTIMGILNPGNLPLARAAVYKIAQVKWEDGTYMDVELGFLSKFPPGSTKQTFYEDGPE